MKNSELRQANIGNMTSLWKTAGLPFHSYISKSDFDYCMVPNSEWPNRLWFTGKRSNEETLQAVLDVVKSSSIKLLLPVWDNYSNNYDEALQTNGFIQQFELLGMSLRLGRHFVKQNHLNIIRVSSEKEARHWTDIYPTAFGYRISPDILMKTLEEIHYYLAYYQDQPAGTAIQFNTKNVSGIHGIGVIPEMRKRGFAEEIMKFLLNRAIEIGKDYATLQASDMGKGLYLKLGFEEQFTIKHYGLK